MTFPQGQRVPWDAPVHKTVISCCGYDCLQGTPAPWTCPACQATHTAHLPKPDPEG